MRVGNYFPSSFLPTNGICIYWIYSPSAVRPASDATNLNAASMPNSIVVAPIPELVEDEDIVDPRDVMHEDLADFYINAGATTNVARCTAVYRLHEVMNSRISNIKFNVWVGIASVWGDSGWTDVCPFQ